MAYKGSDELNTLQLKPSCKNLSIQLRRWAVGDYITVGGRRRPYQTAQQDILFTLGMNVALSPSCSGLMLLR